MSRTILLVEDEAFVREVACEVLRSAGYRVLAASIAAQAIAMFRGHANEVDLLLTDVVLPDQSGYDLARAISAALGGLRTIFISGISGYPEYTKLRKGLRRKGWFHLAKPFSVVTGQDGRRRRCKLRWDNQVWARASLPML